MASYRSSNSSGSGFVPRRSNPSPVRSTSGTSSSYTHHNSRPRSFLGSSPLSSGAGSYGGYGGLGLSSSVGSYGSGSLYHGSGGYGSPATTYGGTNSGYGGLTVPMSSTSASSYSLSSSPKSRSSSPANSYYSSYLSPSSAGYGSSRNLPVKSNSFNRTLASRRSPVSSMGPRSGSLSSLAVSTRSGDSEGYSSGADWSGRSSRLNSVSSAGGGDSAPSSRTTVRTGKAASENGELDYKKLYEESLVENDRLRETLKKTDKELTESKSQLSKLASEPSKSSLSEMEKRERRAMERKLSEMEEELKQLQKLKAENERLKAENRALTRVVSKLTTSANIPK